MFTEPEARATFEALGGEACGWRNELVPRFAFALPKYAAGTAERLPMPLLMCLADRDLQTNSTFGTRIAPGHRTPTSATTRSATSTSTWAAPSIRSAMHSSHSCAPTCADSA